MAGLIENEMGGTLIKPMLPEDNLAQATSVGIDPERRTIDAAKESVAGQLDSLLKSGSPLLERARAGATQTANSRGLVNSTMAAQAGEAAAIDAALPIANADANIYGTAARDNQAAGNTALQISADATNKASMVNADSANQMALQSLRGNQATGLANIEANYKTLLQASDSAAKLYTTLTQGMTVAMADPNTTPEQKQAAVTKLSSLLQSGLTVIGSIGNINLASLLNFA